MTIRGSRSNPISPSPRTPCSSAPRSSCTPRRMGFNVYGFLGYDVLFQFDPFRFIANLYGGIALREGTSVIAGITLTGQLTGPSPWDAQGEASLSFLFFDIAVSFHVTWGDPPPAIPAQTDDLLAPAQGGTRRHAQLARRSAAQQPPAREPAQDRACRKSSTISSSIRWACSPSASVRCRSRISRSRNSAMPRRWATPSSSYPTSPPTARPQRRTSPTRASSLRRPVFQAVRQRQALPPLVRGSAERLLAHRYGESDCAPAGAPRCGI